MEQIDGKNYIKTYDASYVPLVFDDEAYVEVKYKYYGKPDQPAWFDWYIGSNEFRFTGRIERTIHAPESTVKKVQKIDLQ